MNTYFIHINSVDNVGVAVLPFQKGDSFTTGGKEITVIEDIPAGHKIALKDFAEGENIIKYGYPIGHAIQPILQGQRVDDKNLKTNLEGLLEYTYHPQLTELDIPTNKLTFQGYLRNNGEAGIRNEIWVIPTVGCVNGVANRLVENLRQETGGEGVDAIVAIRTRIRT